MLPNIVGTNETLLFPIFQMLLCS